MNSGLDTMPLSSHSSHALQLLNVFCFKQIRDCWTLLNKGRKVEKTNLCEWIAQAQKKSLCPNNIKSDFKKTRIWPLHENIVTNRMQPSKGFEEGQQEFQPSNAEKSSGGESSNGKRIGILQQSDEHQQQLLTQQLVDQPLDLHINCNSG